MIYFGMGKTYEERQEYAQKQYGFKCDYCKFELENNPQSSLI